MKILVTGAAGFIGSHLVDGLLAAGHQVIGVDNLSTGHREFLSEALRHSRFRFEPRDLSDPKALHGILEADCDWVAHLAANADVRYGLEHPRRDIEQNVLATSHVLEAMRQQGVRRFLFSSTGSVYGETSVIPTPENAPFPVQTSLYGASKLAAEGLIGAYSEGCGFQGVIFRFVSILGERYSHGHVFDFVRQLRAHPDHMDVLGDGKQRKSYLSVEDCGRAMRQVLENPPTRPVEIFNLGTDEYVDVNQSLDIICEEMNVRPKRRYSGGDRGWPGDNPFIFLDCRKIRATGWKPGQSIREAVRRTVRFLLANPWLLEEGNP